MTPVPPARPATATDIPAIAIGMDEAFPADRTEDWVRWRFFDRPDPESRSWVVDVPGEGIVGHLAAEAQPAWIDGRREVVYTGSFLYVTPGWRGRGVLEALSRASAELRGSRWLNFPFDRSVPAVHRFLRRDRPAADRMPQWVRWHTGAAVCRSSGVPGAAALRPVAALAVSANQRIARRRCRALAVRPGPGPADAHDELARRSAGFARAVRIRDWRWVEWRWLRDLEPVTLAHVVGEHGLEGYVAWRRNPVTDVAQVVDLLAGTSAAVAALVRHAADELGAVGAERVVVDIADGRAETRTGLRTAGFLPRGVGPPIVAHEPPGMEPLAPEDWYLTLADTDHV
jgi:hypothetical protein